MSIGLRTDFYELTMAQGYFYSNLRDTRAVFDLYFRQNPFGGGYAIFAGLEEAVEALTAYRFSDTDLEYLSSLGFRQEFLDYLARFRFRGDVDAFEEGDVVFGNEPLVRVSGSIIETQLVETLLLNIINFQTLVATKARRTVDAARGRSVVDFGMRRAQGAAALAAARAAFIGGVDGTSNTEAAARFGIPAVGTHAHSWIQSFDSELTAFQVFADIYPDRCTLLVDTFDTLKSGMPNAIRVARELEKRGHSLYGIRLDSGDLAYFSRKAREALDAAGLRNVRIVASNQLDEHLIASLINQGAPIDVFGVGTRMITAYDQPALDGVYKLAEIDGHPSLKFSENPEKINLPGCKTVVRFINGEDRFAMDGILLNSESPGRIQVIRHPSVEFKLTRLSEENLTPETVFHPIMRQGQPLRGHRSPADIRTWSLARFQQLPEGHRRFIHPHIYRVGISNRLYELRRELIGRRLDHG